ncbi:hypothetical protein KUCAC02_008400, partial [Chaenocephalus aceratus]
DPAIGEGVNRYWFSRVMQKLKEGFNLNFGTAETATISIRDCPDMDLREKIQILKGNSELSAAEKESVNTLCLAWDLPVMSNDKRRWLFERLLYHAESSAVLTPESILDRINWPTMIDVDDDAALWKIRAVSQDTFVASFKM